MAGEVNEAPGSDRIPLAHFSYGALYQEGRCTLSAQLIAYSHIALLKEAPRHRRCALSLALVSNGNAAAIGLLRGRPLVVSRVPLGQSAIDRQGTKFLSQKVQKL
jgi:hypothetical protein